MKRLAVIFLFCGSCLIAGGAPPASSPMVAISGGLYQRPLEQGGKPRTVRAYQLDVRQVTNAEFLAFVSTHPEWRRSRVNRLFADPGYLSHWTGDTEPGPSAPPDSPVVRVSWHAARAFLKSVDKRLPTVDEWEFAARADAVKPDAGSDPEFRQQILDWYSRPVPAILPAAGSQPPNFHGVSGMHGIVWEWTRDFVSAMTSGEARADGTRDAQLFCAGGGSDPAQATEYANFMRVAFRSSLQGDFCLPSLGFRGARDGPSENNPVPSP